MSKIKTFDDAAMMRNPKKWPSWPYLPVKHLNHDLKDKNLGLLFANENCRWTVFHVYLFRLPKTIGEFMSSPKTEYGSLEALLADGWIVD